MSFWRKQQWDRMISNSSLPNSLHGGSVPNLLSVPRSESSGTLKTRVSIDFLRDWASDLGNLSTGLNLNLSSAKWPSLVTVCKWKQALTEKLKKRPSSNAEESQVRTLDPLQISAIWGLSISQKVFKYLFQAGWKDTPEKKRHYLLLF